MLYIILLVWLAVKRNLCVYGHDVMVTVIVKTSLETCAAKWLVFCKRKCFSVYQKLVSMQ